MPGKMTLFMLNNHHVSYLTKADFSFLSFFVLWKTYFVSALFSRLVSNLYQIFPIPLTVFFFCEFFFQVKCDSKCFKTFHPSNYLLLLIKGKSFLRLHRCNSQCWFSMVKSADTTSFNNLVNPLKNELKVTVQWQTLLHSKPGTVG